MPANNTSVLTNENIRNIGNAVDGLMQSISTKFTGEITGVSTRTNNLRSEGGSKVISIDAQMTKGTAVIKTTTTIIVKEVTVESIEEIENLAKEG